jgi:hypothetical protein
VKQSDEVVAMGALVSLEVCKSTVGLAWVSAGGWTKQDTQHEKRC